MSITEILKETFGYDEFRHHQESIIENVIAGKDTLAVMPTGGGKSLCYQIPAIAADGVTIVISPLISLMKDQVTQLEARNVPSVMLNSSIKAEEYKESADRVRRGDVKLIYMAPETILLDKTTEMLEHVKVSYIAVDEAHCISEWGHEFRPSYRQLIQLREMHPDATCIALTATATARVRKDICKILGINDDSEFISSFDRPNLHISVKKKQEGWGQVFSFIRDKKGKCGIIYCSSRKKTEALAEALQGRGYSAIAYHAGLGTKLREENQERFMNGDVNIIVATIAFGMGIDKPDVRWILHYDIPSNIESYYQQIGRAGRDGNDSECKLLFGKKDIGIIRWFHNKLPPGEKKIASGQLNTLINYCETKKCRRRPLMNYFGEKYTQPNCGNCDACI